MKNINQGEAEILLNECPNSVDSACEFAYAESQAWREKNSQLILERFLEKYSDELNDVEKAKVYTNLAFYYNDEGNIKEYDYLSAAVKLKSPYIETYRGLALYHFTAYREKGSVEELKKSLRAFEKGTTVSDDYEMNFGRAVCLFELKEYEKAKTIFLQLLESYPNRMRLLLSIAYCDVYLGYKDQAMNRLKQIKLGEDEQYKDKYYNSDIIDDFQVYDAYYVLGEYSLFLEECEKAKVDCIVSRPSYYFALWVNNQYDYFKKEIAEKRKELILSLEETKVDEDFSSEEEKQNYIKSWEEDIEDLDTLVYKIKNENFTPILELQLWPEYGCYLIECLTYNF